MRHVRSLLVFSPRRTNICCSSDTNLWGVYACRAFIHCCLAPAVVASRRFRHATEHRTQLQLARLLHVFIYGRPAGPPHQTRVSKRSAPIVVAAGLRCLPAQLLLCKAQPDFHGHVRLRSSGKSRASTNYTSVLHFLLSCASSCACRRNASSRIEERTTDSSMRLSNHRNQPKELSLPYSDAGQSEVSLSSRVWGIL